MSLNQILQTMTVEVPVAKAFDLLWICKMYTVGLESLGEKFILSATAFSFRIYFHDVAVYTTIQK